MKTPRPVRTHTFNGRRYKIIICPYSIDGITDQYSEKRCLCVFEDLRIKNGLITCIHEALHAENWLKSEADVDRVSKEIGNFLWRLGYRWSLPKENT